MRLLFDTNVLLDVLLRRAPHEREAALLWSAAETGRVTGLVAATAVTTLAYLIERAYDRAQAVSDVSAVLTTFEVAPVGRAELSAAASFRDFEDGVVHAAALASRADGIVTRNGSDFRPPRGAATLPVYSPAEVLAVLDMHDRPGSGT